MLYMSDFMMGSETEEKKTSPYFQGNWDNSCNHTKTLQLGVHTFSKNSVLKHKLATTRNSMCEDSEAWDKITDMRNTKLFSYHHGKLSIEQCER